MYNNGRQCRKHNFTKTFIDGLPPNPKKAKSREQEYSDQQVIGLRVMVSKNGRKFFHLRYRFRKRKRAISIGEFPSVSVQEARARANEFKNMLSHGLDPLTEKDRQTNDITFAEFVEQEYMPFAKINKKTWRDDLSKIKNDMNPAFGNLLLKALTPKDMQKYQTMIKARNSPSTSNRHLTVLIRILNLAIQWEFLEQNPCRGLTKYTEPKKGRYLHDDELKRFLTALDEVEQSVSAQVIRFLLFTGLRLSEATHLLWENINFDAGTVLLPNTKSGKSRTVILNELAKDVVVKMAEHKKNKFLFPGLGPKGFLTSPRRKFELVKTKAGIENLRLHDLRHTFASLCVNAGQNLYEVQKLLGHSSSQMTQRYAHLGDKELRAATESVANQIKHIAS
jgi:integrase